MKKLIYFLGLAALTALASGCSNDDSPEVTDSRDVISFNAVVPNRSRTAPTTTATINEFVVYAFTEKSTLIDGAKVSREGGLWTYSPEAYWPVTPVHFYAFSPDITSSPNIKGSPGSNNIPDYLNDGTVDLLYSVKTNVVQQAAPVELNFRHAMSNVNVLLSSTNPRIKVVVQHILLSNVYIQGTFEFPTQSTLASSPEVTGNWSVYKNLNNQLLFYALSETDGAVLTPVPTNYTVGTLEVSFVLPQPLTDVSIVDGKYIGSYISVECEIFDTATGQKIWPNSHTPDDMLVAHSNCGRIVYPATSETVKAWLPGHAYNYNISINNPSVLDKIEFDVAVDEYVIDEM